MKEKVKRLLDLVRAGRLSLEDAAPLLAALSPRLALTEADRELIASLLAREEMETGQVAEHLLLLRGVRDIPAPPPPPRAPSEVRVDLGGFSPPNFNMEGLMGGVSGVLGRAVDVIGAVSGSETTRRGAEPGRVGRILRVQVESGEGAEYTANLPVSLAPHLHRLIPAHGIRALERAGLSVEALQLLIEAEPPPGDLIDAEDGEGNSVKLSLK